MSEPCEIVEALATATSSCPTIEVVVIAVGVAVSTTTAFAGVTPPTIVESATCTSVTYPESYALPVSSGAASSVLFPTLDFMYVVSNSAEATNTMFAVFTETRTSSAEASSTVYPETYPAVSVSAGIGSSATFIANVAATTLVNSASAASLVYTGLLESVTSSAAATSTTVVVNMATMEVVSEGASASVSYPSTSVDLGTIVNVGAATSTTVAQLGAQLTLVSEAEAESSVAYRDETKIAWVMNTETTAGSRYDNFDFESIVQTTDGVFAVGIDGLYLLDHIADDEGDQIAASVTSGFVDFGVTQQKRLDGVYFGYTSDGKINVTVEVKDSGHQPYTYSLEQSASSAPVNGRVVPGKGLVGRYWRITVSNKDGAYFAVYDATIDIAVSARRL